MRGSPRTLPPRPRPVGKARRVPAWAWPAWPGLARHSELAQPAACAAWPRLRSAGDWLTFHPSPPSVQGQDRPTLPRPRCWQRWSESLAHPEPAPLGAPEGSFWTVRFGAQGGRAGDGTTPARGAKLGRGSEFVAWTVEPSGRGGRSHVLSGVLLGRARAGTGGQGCVERVAGGRRTRQATRPRESMIEPPAPRARPNSPA